MYGEEEREKEHKRRKQRSRPSGCGSLKNSVYIAATSNSRLTRRTTQFMIQLIFFAGLLQLILVIGSLAIPRVLNWSQDTAKLRPMTRQVFWTYAAYIWATNLSFALISMLSPQSLLDRSFLASAVTIYITVYWAARIGIQFFYFDRTDAPQGLIFQIAEWALVALFVALTGIYATAAVLNLSGAGT